MSFNLSDWAFLSFCSTVALVTVFFKDNDLCNQSCQNTQLNITLYIRRFILAYKRSKSIIYDECTEEPLRFVYENINTAIMMLLVRHCHIDMLKET